MTWAEVLNDPCLQDLPYKIELDEFGNIIMSPASNPHARKQGNIAGLLRLQLNSGEVLGECSIQTSKGVKCPDVAWGSDSFLKKYGSLTPFPVAPEICVEILSPSNSTAQIAAKRDLYFAKGAREVWTCDRLAVVRFY